MGWNVSFLWPGPLCLEAKHTNFLHPGPGPGPAKLRLSQTGILSWQCVKVGNIGNQRTSGPKKDKEGRHWVFCVHTAQHDGKGNSDKTLCLKLSGGRGRKHNWESDERWTGDCGNIAEDCCKNWGRMQRWEEALFPRTHRRCVFK